MPAKDGAPLDVSYILNGYPDGYSGQSSTRNSTSINRRVLDLLRWRLTERNKIQLWGVICLVMSTILTCRLLFGTTNSYLLLFGRICVLIGSILGTIISFNISTSIAPHCTPAHIMVIQYIFYQINGLMGDYYLMRLEKESADCQEHQEKFILRQMKRRGNSHYGRDFDFASIKSVADFRTRHPITGYSHYAGYMDRVAAGEPNVVLPGRPSRLGITSGTTGKPKLVAITKERNVAFLFKIMPMVFRLVTKQYTPNLSPLQKKCMLYVHYDADKSPGGLPIGPTTMLVLPDILHRIQFSTPPVGMRLTNERQALYVHALFALRDRYLGNLGTIFCSTMFTFFQNMEQDWPSLVNDLRHGKISRHIGLDDDVRTSLESELNPEPERAMEVEREFRKGFDDIARRLWPHLCAIFAISTGAMVVYARRLKEKYTKDFPIISSAYSSTEGTIGMLHSVDGLDTKYIMTPSDVFCEFIPVDHSHEDQPETLLAHEVEIGQCYEIVLTSLDALYRYRMGDVIKIVDFKNQTPIFQFMYRTGEVLNVRCEKTPEVLVGESIQETISDWQGLSLVDFSTVESPLYEEAMGITKWSPCGYYMIFMELEEAIATFGKEKEQRAKFANDLDAKLRTKAPRYDYYRSNNSIAPLKVVFLQPGAINDLRKYILERSTAASQQLKLPHKLRKAEWIRLFCDLEL